MKKVSQVELKRLKKKGKVRRKMGAQPEAERSESVAPVDEGMSGSEATERPALALPEPAPEPMASMSASMDLRDGLLKDLIDNNTQAIRTFGERLENMTPGELSKWHRADFIRHNVKRNKDRLIDYVDSIPMEAGK